MPNFPHYHQPDSKDCGPTCLKIVAKYYGKSLSLPLLRQLSETTREGSNLLTLSEAAESIGFRTLGVKISLEKLLEAPLPCILHWNNNHYVVLASIQDNSKGIKGLFNKFFSKSNNQTPSTQHPTLFPTNLLSQKRDFFFNKVFLSKSSNLKMPTK
jgi:ABC-type bacteriocin/lantibiotic exporter with double-glycine peptidase domain